MALDAYVSELGRILSRSLAADDVFELVSEARNHLTERADELRNQGRTVLAAEEEAVAGFGDVNEIAADMVQGYPPKPPVDLRRVRFLPEIALAVELVILTRLYFIYGGAHGLESVASCVVSISPMFIIPAMSSGLARLKYRRLRPLFFQIRMATYGIGLCLLGTACLVGLQITGRATPGIYHPMYYAFTAVACLCYAIMQTFNRDGKVYRFLQRCLSPR